MSYDRYERRQLRLERKLARRAARQHVPLDIALPIDGLSGAELDAQLRKRAQARMQRRSDFYKGLVAFVVLNLFFWGIWAVTTTPGAFPWPIFVTLIMGVALSGEAVVMYQDSATMVRRRENRIQREIEIDKMRLGLANDPYEKPKNHQAMRLSDDGELLPVDDEDVEQPAKPQRG